MKADLDRISKKAMATADCFIVGTCIEKVIPKEATIYIETTICIENTIYIEKKYTF